MKPLHQSPSAGATMLDPPRCVGRVIDSDSSRVGSRLVAEPVATEGAFRCAENLGDRPAFRDLAPCGRARRADAGPAIAEVPAGRADEVAAVAHEGPLTGVTAFLQGVCNHG